ncbi:MAG: adenylyl-sulfate kinase [Acidobacteria bacterium]|nr:adenylyl-sulfate kinase [Acidobacteriota bacterium]
MCDTRQELNPCPRALGVNDRRRLNGHGSWLVWLTGLSGSGKSTLARMLEAELHRRGRRVFHLDGDHLRTGLNAGLGFSAEDRRENIRRAGEVARLLVEAGLGVVAAFISPYRADRDRVRALFAPGEFAEVHVRCSLETCERRDVNGLYRKARAGGLPGFTGIDDPYEEPLEPELVLDTEALSPAGALDRLLALTDGLEARQRPSWAGAPGQGAEEVS